MELAHLVRARLSPWSPLLRVVALGLVVHAGRLLLTPSTPPATVVVTVPAGSTPGAVQAARDEALMLRLATELGWDRSDPVINRHLAAGAAFVDPDLPAPGEAARSWGLGADDPLVRQRLLDRVERVLSAPDVEPDEAVLDAWRLAHAERFQRPAAVSFDHVLVMSDRHPGQAEAVAASTLARLEAGEPAAGDPLPGLRLHDTSTLVRLRTLWGDAVAASVATAPVGTWVRADSSRGAHLLRVTSRPDATLPPLEAIRAEVRADWGRDTAPTRRRARLDDLAVTWPVTVVTP